VAPDAEFVVVGGGVMGLATAWALAREGRDVTVLEQFQVGHDRGSSHGTSRIFRLSYDHSHYVRLAQRALVLWHELEAESGETVLVTTGSLDFGQHVDGNRRALAECGVEFEVVEGAEAGRRYGLEFDGGSVLVQCDGGFVRADRAQGAFRDCAIRRGAHLLEETRVLGLRLGDGEVMVETSGEQIAAQTVVVTAGAWAKPLVPGLGFDLPVTPTRETVAYFRLQTAGDVPSLIESDTERAGFGFYALSAPGVGLKAGRHRSGPVTDPDQAGEVDREIARAIAAWVGERFPAADREPIGAETCLYTNTPDESFVLERRGRVVLGSACSGHGFKFAPAVGEELATLALEAV
jgi:sarcosine oxidase